MGTDSWRERDKKLYGAPHGHTRDARGGQGVSTLPTSCSTCLDGCSRMVCHISFAKLHKAHRWEPIRGGKETKNCTGRHTAIQEMPGEVKVSARFPHHALPA